MSAASRLSQRTRAVRRRILAQLQVTASVSLRDELRREHWSDDEIVELTRDASAALTDHLSDAGASVYNSLAPAVTRYLDARRALSHLGISAAHEVNLALHGLRLAVGWTSKSCPCPSCERKHPCALVDPFHDGELSAERADRFRDHLATCDACQRRLESLMTETLSMSLAADPQRS